MIVPGIFAAVPYCIDLIGGPWVDTRPEVCKAFRPKSALKAREEALKAAAEKAVPDVPEKTEAPQPPEKAPEAETRQTPPLWIRHRFGFPETGTLFRNLRRLTSKPL